LSKGSWPAARVEWVEFPANNDLMPIFTTNDPAPLLLTAHLLAPSLSRGNSVVYFLRLQSGLIYVGTSTDLEQRLVDHRAGQACETTRRDQPVGILRIEFCPTFSDARRREAQLKKWSHAKKEALVTGNLQLLRKLSESHETSNQR
jgi:putative endonuclease